MNKKLGLIVVAFSFFLGCSQQGNELQKLIGLEINSEPIQEYLNNLEVKPEITKYDSGSYYYVYKEKGLELVFSDDDILVTIFIYSESSNDYRKFQGNIPHNITFSDTRKEVEQKLGPPDVNGGGGVIRYWSSWVEEGVSVTYKDNDQEDMMNKIHRIRIRKKNDG